MKLIVSYYTMEHFSLPVEENEVQSNLLQVCSDVHLERGDITINDFPSIIEPCAEILALAGDIGDPYSPIFEEFIRYCSSRFRYVLFVSGNHEYYGHDMRSTDRCIENLFGYYTNVIYLNNRTFEYEGILFVGSTLWSNIPGDVSTYDLSSYQDYVRIEDFDHQQASILHQRNVDFIREELTMGYCIVITHHAPSYTCISDEYLGNKLNCCFASHLDDLLKYPNLLGWVYGHTHHNISRVTDKHFLYANCYRTENYNPRGVPHVLG